MQTQNTEEWLAWRKKGLGASDAPILLGISPWKTPYQLWLDKLEPVTYAGKTDKVLESNFAIDKGHALEPSARAKYELLTGIEMGPAVVTHKEMQWLRASMDGFNPKENIGLEIKCPGKAAHEKAQAGEVPEHYYAQIQHQIIVTGASRVDYFSYYLDNDSYKHGFYDKGDHVLLHVEPDMDFIRDYLQKAEAFWKCVQDKTPPGFTDLDFVPIREKGLKDLIQKYECDLMQYEIAKNNLEESKKQILEVASKHDHKRMKAYDLRITKVERKGSVDYKKIPELKEVDLESYRKPETFFYKLAVKKDD